MRNKLIDRLYEACLNATGAYEALKLMELDRELPGYDHCVKYLNEVIGEYQNENPTD